MPILNNKNAKVVRERLAKLPGFVTLAIFAQEFECEYCRQTRELAEEVAGLSAGKVRTEVYDLVRDKANADQMGIDKIPALALLGGNVEDYGIRFFGIPAGYEFSSLLESFDIVAKGDSGLAPVTREKLKALTSSLSLQVFVTPTCPYCPRAVLTAFRFAMESEKVHASMVEASEFPYLTNKYQVSGVPHTVIGVSLGWKSVGRGTGAYESGGHAPCCCSIRSGQPATACRVRRLDVRVISGAFVILSWIKSRTFERFKSRLLSDTRCQKLLQ